MNFHLNNLNCFLPLSGIDGGVESFESSSGFDIVVDGRIKLLAVGQVVAPLFLEVNDLARKGSTGKVDSSGVRMAFAETFQGLKN